MDFVILFILIWMAIRGFDSTYDWNASGFFSNVFQFFCVLTSIFVFFATLGLIGKIVGGWFASNDDD